MKPNETTSQVETVMLKDGRTIYRRDPARDGVGEIRERAADGSSSTFARTHGNVVAMLDTLLAQSRELEQLRAAPPVNPETGLVACPWCGGANVDNLRFNGTADANPTGVRLCCDDCGCEGPEGTSEAHARELWNRRASPAQQWVKVEDGVPAPSSGEFSKGVLTFEPVNKNTYVDWYVWKPDGTGAWKSGRTYSHWMPVPAAPVAPVEEKES